jgi:hypothetical protein
MSNTEPNTTLLSQALKGVDAHYEERHQKYLNQLEQAKHVLHNVVVLLTEIARQCELDIHELEFNVCLLDRNGAKPDDAVWHSMHTDTPAFMESMKNQAAQRVKENGGIDRFHFTVSLSLPPIRDTKINFKYSTFSVVEKGASVLTASVLNGQGINTTLKAFPWATEIPAITAFMRQDMQPLYGFLRCTLPPVELDFNHF